MLSKCEHMNFKVRAAVNRLTDENGVVNNYAADISISCSDCNEPFQFICPDRGMLWDRPTASLEGFELRAPILPKGAKFVPPKANQMKIHLGPPPKNWKKGLKNR